MSTLKERLDGKAEEMRESLDEFGEAIYAQLSRPIPNVEEARNSLKIIVDEEYPWRDKDYFDVFWDVVNKLLEHQTQRNPHNLQPSQLDPPGYTKSEFNALFTNYIPSSVSPFSFFYYNSRHTSGGGLKAVGAFITADYTGVTLALAGKYWEFSALQARTRGNTPGVYYLYAQLRGGEPELRITNKQLELNYHRMMLATITLTAQGSAMLHAWDEQDGAGRLYEIDSARVTAVSGQNRGRGIPMSIPNQPLGSSTLIWY